MNWIDQCLKSCGDYPVIVVDNASADDTVGFIEQQFPNVTLLKQDTNLGFGQANNLGVSYALNHGAKQVFLLNQDAYLEETTITQMVEVHKQYPEYGVLSPMHLNGRGDTLDYNFLNYIKRSKTFLTDCFLPQKSTNKNHLVEIEFVNAALWLISKECLKEVGGFNPYFFLYGEDRDYINRVHYKGFKLGVVLNTFGYHDRVQKDSISKSQKIDTTLFEVQLLNPASKVNFKDESIILYKSFIKNLFRLKFNNCKRILKKLNVLRSNLNELETYSSLSKSNKKFLYIK
ncbi:glycosyltransferase [Mangrovimonas yunxiaonensis]|nr:glycosyltransferase [Mangrovimonas yunxiaonensis]GGH46030.1 hypothetical protein GCM10011364_19920 [Mangrovimonas yunxiaonensis]